MQILINPENIIKRCLWAKYKKFVLKGKSDEEVNKIIEENVDTIISENDAYVIGLLKVIETENLIHRFNLHVDDFLKIKSTINKERVIINKSALLKEILEFKDMFPDAYKPNSVYLDAITDMKKYVVEIYELVEQLEIIQVPQRDGKIYTYVLSSDVNKIITKK